MPGAMEFILLERRLRRLNLSYYRGWIIDLSFFLFQVSSYPSSKEFQTLVCQLYSKQYFPSYQETKEAVRSILLVIGYGSIPSGIEWTMGKKQTIRMLSQCFESDSLEFQSFHTLLSRCDLPDDQEEDQVIL
jgi:hypothetical protein